jgi:hypothetical protein
MADAQQVVSELRQVGFTPDEIVQVPNDDQDQNASTSPSGVASTGTKAGGFMTALSNAGVPNEDIPVFEEGIRRGGVLVSLQVHEESRSRAHDVMSRHQPIDVNPHPSEQQPANLPVLGDMSSVPDQADQQVATDDYRAIRKEHIDMPHPPAEQIARNIKAEAHREDDRAVMQAYEDTADEEEEQQRRDA